MIQGFIEDSAVWKKSALPLVPETEIDQGVGYLNSKIKSFFVTPMCIIDSRTDRLTVLAVPLQGQMKLWFDSAKISTEEQANDLTTAQWNYINNLVEYVTYATALSIEDLEAYLVAHPELFGTYEANSLFISTSVSADILCNLNNGSTYEGEVRRSFQFDYTNGVETVTIKLWMTSNSFYLEYPLYSIERVVPPCDPHMFLNPITANTIPTVISASNYDAPLIDAQVTDTDNTGTYTYRTNYVNSNLSSTYSVPFMIFYKGHEPSTLSIRVAVREYLESIPGIDPSIWPPLFPDLYTEVRMYIIPIWNNVTQLPEYDLYPSITTFNTILPIVEDVFPGLQPNFINDYLSLTICNSSSVQLIAIPDPANTTLQTLIQIHPTYKAVDSRNTDFELQTITTRDFNIKLCNAISTILGSSTTSGSFVTITEDGRQYLTFISGLIEYCVLHINSFPF